MTDFEHGARYVVNADGVPVKQTKRSNKGWVVEGEAIKYSTVILHDFFGPSRFIEVQPGAFDISIKYEAPVQLWLDHDKKLAMPGVRVELYSDERALSFRAHLDDSELAFHAHDLVKSGLYNQVSLGWDTSKTITRDVEGKQLVYIVQGILREVSLLPAGACASTHCQVSRLADCGTLAHDSKSLRFRSDNDFVALRRAFQKLESET